MVILHFCKKKAIFSRFYKFQTLVFLLIFILVSSASILPINQYSNVISIEEIKTDGDHGIPLDSGKNLSQFIQNPTDLIEPIAPQDTVRILNDDFQIIEEQDANDVNFYGWGEWNSAQGYMVRSNEYVYADAYSAKLVLNNTAYSGGAQNFYQNYPSHPLLTAGAVFSFAWRLGQIYNVSIYNDYIFVRIAFNNSRTVLYFIAGDAINNSNEAKYQSANGNTTGTWFTENRTLYTDYVNMFGVPSNVGITSIYVTAFAQTKRPGAIIAYFDSFRLFTNAQERILNPGFENAGANLKPNNWFSEDYINPIIRNMNYSVGKGIELQLNPNPRIENDYFVNCNINLEWYENNMGDLYVNSSRRHFYTFDYRVDSLSNLNSYFAYLRLGFYNTSFYYFQVNVYITSSNPPYSNTTSVINIYPSTPQGSWGSIMIDVSSIIQLFPSYIGHLFLTSILLSSYVSSMKNGQMKIQIANSEYRIERYGGSYLDFENYTSSVAPFDFYNALGNVLINNSFAKNGQKSLMLRAVDTTISRIQFMYKYQAFTPETSIQFDYYINYTGGFNPSNYAAITFYLYNYRTDETRSITYLLSTPVGSYSNTSDSIYLVLPNSNKTGVWQEIRRNLFRDYEKGFGSGSASETYLFYFELYVMTDMGSTLTLFVDDIKTGSTIPIYENSTLRPSTLLYDRNATFYLDLFDSGSGIKNATLYYRLSGSSGWQSSNMSQIDSDSQEFVGIIPASELEYNKTLEYYFEFEDFVSNRNRYPQSGALTVGITDKTAPKINSIWLNPSIPRSLLPSDIYLNVSDDGAGVVNVMLFYSFDGMNWLNQSAIKEEENIFKARVVMQSGFLQHYFIAEDAEGNVVNSKDEGFDSMIYVEGLLRSVESFGAGFAAALVLFIIIKKKRGSKK